MTTAEADTRLRTAELALANARRRHVACTCLPRPVNRRQLLRRSDLAGVVYDDIRRAVTEVEAATIAAKGGGNGR